MIAEVFSRSCILDGERNTLPYSTFERLKEILHLGKLVGLFNRTAG
jgi:hypothetical protein